MASLRTLLVVPPLRPGPVQVEGDEAHHGRAVLRLEAGDPVRLADGAGQVGTGIVVQVGKNLLRVEVAAVETVDDGPGQGVTVLVAPPKGDRLADLVRGLTELGVGAIGLLACERGERMPGSLDRLERIANEAVKQSRRGWRPLLRADLPLDRLAASDPPWARAGQRVLGGGPLVTLDPQGAPASALAAGGGPVRLVIGPEGGLTAVEVAHLAAQGARRVRLAAPILRIETAALAAAAVWVAAAVPALVPLAPLAAAGTGPSP